MNGNGFTYKLTMCNPQIYASNIATIFTFTIFSKIIALSLESIFLSKINKSSVITPPKHMQTLSLYRLQYRCLKGDAKHPPPRTFRTVRIGRGQPPVRKKGSFLDPPENCYLPARF